MVRRAATVAVVVGAAFHPARFRREGFIRYRRWRDRSQPEDLLGTCPCRHGAAISEEDALRIAWREEGRSDATLASATLAISRTSGEEGVKETPVWIVTYEGVCIRAHGPPPGSNECVASTH
jgi:hypothetical protein